MSYVKIKEGRYEQPTDVINSIFYITDLIKCGYHPLYNTNKIISVDPLLSPELVASQFLIFQDAYPNPYKRRIYHIICSLDNQLDEPRKAIIFSIGLAFSMKYINYQSIFTVHQNTNNLHLHLIINNIPVTGTKTLSSYLNLLDLETIANCVIDEYWWHPSIPKAGSIDPYKYAFQGLDRFNRM